jgi:hypothetical protein
VRDQRLDNVEVVVSVDVAATVEVAIDVVVVEEVERFVVGGVSVSVDDVACVVAVDYVKTEDLEDDALVVSVKEAAVVSTDDVIGVEIAVVIGAVVRVELSIGLNLTALAAVIFKIITPSTDKKRVGTRICLKRSRSILTAISDLTCALPYLL